MERQTNYLWGIWRWHINQTESFYLSYYIEKRNCTLSGFFIIAGNIIFSISSSESKHWNSLAFVQKAFYSVKKVFLEISQNSQENTRARVSFLIKLIKKETLAKVFSCELCETSKNTFLHRTLLVAASVHWLSFGKLLQSSAKKSKNCNPSTSRIK